MDDAPPIVLATIPKNAREEIRVAIASFRGTRYVDVRLFAALGDPPAFKPTGKGITLRPSALDAVSEALRTAKGHFE